MKRFVDMERFVNRFEAFEKFLKSFLVQSEMFPDPNDQKYFLNIVAIFHLWVYRLEVYYGKENSNFWLFPCYSAENTCQAVWSYT